MRESGASEDDAAGDVDVIACGNEIADDVEADGHGLARKDVAGEKDTGEKGEEGELNGLRLRIGFAGNENADGKRNKKIGQRKKRKNQNVAVDRNLKDEAHEGENQAELGKTDDEIREEAVRNVVTLRRRMAVRPGKRKFGERESGLKSILGRISTARVARS